MASDRIRNEIRNKLKKNGLTNTWLILQLKQYNFKVDKSEMSSVLSGTRKGTKAEDILKYSLTVLLFYEKCFPSTND